MKNQTKVHTVFLDARITLAESERDMNDVLKCLAIALDQFKIKINAFKTKTLLLNKIYLNQKIIIKINYIW